jgi:DNA-binding NtrC family response regulator
MRLHVTRLLIVDDNESIRQMLRYFFLLEGCNVETAADGCAALRLLRDDEIDVVVTDLSMPCLDGSGLIRAIRARRPSCPVILMSGDANGAEVAHLLGDVPFVRKPPSLQRLKELVRTVMAATSTAVDDQSDCPDRGDGARHARLTRCGRLGE